MKPAFSISPLVEELPYKILKINREGIVLDHFSPKGMFFLVKEEDLIGFDLKKYSPIEGLAEKIEYCFENQKVQVLEYVISLPKRRVTLEAQFKPKSDAEAIIVLRDISDIAAFKQEIEEKDRLIKKIEEALTAFTGKEYFDSLSTQLNELFNADHAIIGEVLHNEKIRTISYCADGRIGENFEYNVKNAPCEILLDKELICYQKDVSKIFYKDELIVSNEIEGYLGKALYDNNDNPIGVIIALFKKPIKEEELFRNLINLLSGRATAELKRELSERKLRESEQKLRKTEATFETLYNNTPGMFHSVNADDEIIEVGDFWLEKMGYTREEVVGRKSIEFLSKDCWEYARKVALPQFFKDGYLRNVPYQFVTKKKEKLDVLLSAVIEKSGDDIKALVVLNDVTEINKAQKSLAESEEKFRSLFEESSDAVIISDPESHKILDVNLKMVEMIGFSKEELMSKTIFDIRLKENYLMDRTGFNKFLKTGAQVYESVLVTKSGKRIEIEGSAKLLELGGKKIIQAFLRDITKRKKEEKILNLNKSILERVAKENDIYETLEVMCKGIEDIYPEMICSVLIYDSDNNWLNYGAGPTLPKFYVKAVDRFPVGPNSCSCGTAAFTGKTVVVSDIANDPLWNSAADLAARAKLKACWSVPMNASDNSLLGTFAVYYREVKSPVKRELELITNFSNLIGIALENDLNKRNLISKEERNKSLNDSVLDAIIICNGQAEVVSWNKGAEKIFGFKEEEVTSKSVAVIIPDQYVDACVNGLKRIHKQGKNRRIGNIIETEGRNKKGELFPIEISTSSWLTDDDRFFSAIIRDISERKAIENKQTKLNEYLIKQNKQLEEFAHIASHNLRAPIANIESLLQLQLIDDSEENTQFIFEQLNEVSRNLNTTIGDITEVLRTSWELNKTKQKLKFSVVYDRIMNNISRVIDESVVDVTYNFDTESIEYPPAYLESIMQNLILNAIKYSDPKKEKSWVKVRTENTNGELVFSVEDNGLGLDLNRHGKKLFGLRKTFHKNENARGVGLFITKAQVESMGGTIEVKSQEKRGSKFSVYFNSNSE